MSLTEMPLKNYTDRQKELKAYGKIYKISFLNDSKIYIGATMRSVSERFHEHKHRNNEGARLHTAIQINGVTNSVIEILDYAYSKKELREKEDYWILHLNSLHPEGYNVATNSKYKLPKESCTNMSNWKIGKKRPKGAKIKENKTRAEKYTNADGSLFYSDITQKYYKRADAMRTAEQRMINKRNKNANT